MFLAQTRAFAALTSQARLSSTYCSKPLCPINTAKKHCSVLIVVIHRQRHPRVSYFKELYPSNSSFFLSSLDQMLLRLQTFSTFSFSVLLLRGWNILLAQGPGELSLYCSNLFFFIQPDQNVFFPDQNFAKVFANMMYSFCQKPPCVFKFDFFHRLKH